LQPALVALRYCDGMKGGTLSLLYSLLLELDTTYSKPIKGLDETIHTKLHNVFMSRWSAFHASVHSLPLSCFCNGQTILSEGHGCGRQEGYLVSDGGFF
jgi:hypothetical protein